jgi:aspartate racemase
MEINRQTKLIGILGGVGPMAGVLLQNKIIKYTNVSTDQQHLSTIHLCCPSLINDRSEWLKSQSGDNPGDSMFELAKIMSMNALILKMGVVIGVPCNTFHVSKIFDVFVMKINEWNTKHNYSSDSHGYIKIINMIDLTINYISKYSSVGMLCTSGTKHEKIYDNDTTKIIYLDDDKQKCIQDMIYNTTDGIKKTSEKCEIKTKTTTKYIESLVKNNKVDAIILGCSELPITITSSMLYDVEIINPVDILAKTLIFESYL